MKVYFLKSIIFIQITFNNTKYTLNMKTIKCCLSSFDIVKVKLNITSGE